MASFTHAALQVAITAQSARFIVHLLICANARLIIGCPRNTMLLGDHMHGHLHWIPRTTCSADTFAIRDWRRGVVHVVGL
jgi:hypothetical protein